MSIEVTISSRVTTNHGFHLADTLLIVVLITVSILISIITLALSRVIWREDYEYTAQTS